MKPRTFFAFVAPSLALMMIFIALPLISVLLQSFQNTQGVFEEQVTERCTPSFPSPICEKETRTVPVVDATGRPVTRTINVGLDNYRALLRTADVASMMALAQGGVMGGLKTLLSIDFYHALRFTLTFTFITLPFVILVGLGIALALNATIRSLRGPVIFVSLLPFIITPVIGALSIRWLFVGDGILTVALQWIIGQRFSMFAQGWTIEALMIFYRVWHVAPFAFIIFYAGLQSLNQDTMESAIIDGASHFERLRYVIIPHLMPLIVFVALIHLMDSYRVFEEVIGFSAQAHVISLQWLTFDLLTPDNTGNRAIGRASASSMLTMIGIVIILIPLIRRTWRDQRPR
jgi:multiple sugar transport system permease protein